MSGVQFFAILPAFITVVVVVIIGLGIMAYLDGRDSADQVTRTPEQIENANEWRERCADIMHLDSLPMHHPLKSAFGMVEYAPLSDQPGLRAELEELVRASRLRAMEEAVESVRLSIEAVKADLAKGGRK